MITTFTELDLESSLQDSLTVMNFQTPTPIQAMAIPFGLEGRDILGSAQTGTGKTAAFCIPMINYLLKNHSAHALVMLPTRELASQVHDVARKMIGFKSKGSEGIKTALLIGGEPIGKQYAQLDRRPRLIVGTPGRINDHLRSNPDLVDRVSFVVLDEADRMLDMGFAPQIDSILSETALERQTLMFSATFPENIVKFSKTYLNNPERISAGTQSKPGENIVQENMDVAQEKKYDELKRQLDTREGSVIVFVRTQHSADKISDRLNRDEYAAEAIHGGLRQRQRDKVIVNFRKSVVRVLVATDVAARGLDVPHIEHVINYDLPQVAEDYIHRIGRTARAGAQGHALSFISPGERHLWRDIDRMMNPGKKEVYESSLREDRPRKSGPRKPFGKKPFGKKPFDKGGFEDHSAEGKKFQPRKPFGRADRKDRKVTGQWDPAADFDRAPRSEKPDRPFRKDGERSFNKPRSEGFKPRAEGSFKPRSEGNFKPRSEGGFDRPRQDGNRPFRREGNPQSNRDGFKARTEGFKPRREGGFKSHSENGDRSRSDRPFRKDGAPQGKREGGFKKPYNKDGAAPHKEGGFKKPFSRDGRKDGARPFRKEGGSKPARSAY